MLSEDPQVLLFVLAGAVIVLSATLGLVLGFAGRKNLHRQIDGLRDQVARAESQGKEQSRVVARMRGEQGTVATLALSLPAIVRELNRGDLEPRAVPPLIINIAEALFQPGQLLLYIARPSSGDPAGRSVLQLVAQQGYAEIPDSLKTIHFGAGKIGWIASHRLDMLKEDWVNLARAEGAGVADNHPNARMDIAGPLLHHLPGGEQVLGVICIGSPGNRPRNEKLMLQLVTNLGSLALVNAKLVTKLKDLANTDGLTGLLNKRYFMGDLGDLIVKAGKAAQQVSLFIFDIDHFKNYNDTNGHLEGDRVLRQLSALLRKLLRPADRCCRWGGEEFMIAMPDTESPSAMVVAERIRCAIESFVFDHEEKQPNGRVTISGGVATFPADGAEVLELTKFADEALYKAKHMGRNRVLRYKGVQIGEADDEDLIDLEAATVSDVGEPR